MIKIILTILISIILISCQSAKDAFTLKKKNKTDEFLVEKKNPLTMPPEFTKLPTPDNIQNKETKIVDSPNEDLFDFNKIKVNSEILDEDNSSDLEKNILKQID